MGRSIEAWCVATAAPVVALGGWMIGNSSVIIAAATAAVAARWILWHDLTARAPQFPAHHASTHTSSKLD